MAPIATFSTAALDCSDPWVLAEFYSAITGWSIDQGSDAEWVSLVNAVGASLGFQRVDNYQPPEWPGQEHPQQAHLDFDVDDLDAGEVAVLRIGARKHETQPGTDFRVFLDPEGHPFCLCIEGS